MTDFNYKKYSLERLEEWVHDALSSSEASPQEIYDIIKSAVEEQYYYFKHHSGRCYELLALLNGNGKGHIKAYDEYIEKKENLVCDKDDPSPECKGAWNDFWEQHYYPEEYDKVKKWVLPVEETKDEDTGEDEYCVTFPDDLLEAADLKEGDQVEWMDQGDGSWMICKVTKPLGMDEC
jgi:bifunctional DNA-binding transcriptional regulator/antitoxin component of YhaV-PrlF toxin-antitoxin module